MAGRSYTVRVEVTDVSGTDKAKVTVINNTDVTETTVIPNYDIETDGYTGGGIGVAAFVTYTRRLDNTKLWIDDDDVDSDVDDLVFDDNFTSATVTPTYDDNGNLTFDGVYKYKYDAWNRLVEVRAGVGAESVFATYTYDATGRRISKVVTNRDGADDTTEYYYYAGQQMIETRDGTENATRQFVFGTQYVDEPIRMDADTDNDGDCTDAGGSAFVHYHQDANYNVIALTDSTGAVVQHYLYDAYGTLHIYAAEDTASPDRGDLPAEERLQPVITLGGVDVPNPFTYTGRFHDVETGLYYYRARHHHPALGRFLQRDPLGLSVDASALGPIQPDEQYADGLSLYQFVSSRPHLDLDPTGTQKQKPRSKGECCRAAKAKGDHIDPQTGRPAYGGVVCCDGRKVACHWAWLPDNPQNDAVEDILRLCATEHEKDHFSDIADCPNQCPYLDRPPFKPGKDQDTEECKAYKRELRCLQWNRGRCLWAPNRRAREATIDKQIQSVKSQRNRFCGNAGLPIWP